MVPVTPTVSSEMEENRNFYSRVTSEQRPFELIMGKHSFALVAHDRDLVVDLHIGQNTRCAIVTDDREIVEVFKKVNLTGYVCNFGCTVKHGKGNKTPGG